MRGIVISINISHRKGQKKMPVKEAIVNEYGIVGDAHAGKWHRQISLLAEESIEKMRTAELRIGYGDFAENITTKDIDLSKLMVGQKLKIGKEVILEITQICPKRASRIYMVSAHLESFKTAEVNFCPAA